jgi:uncharacterized protein (TIGR03067 family)
LSTLVQAADGVLRKEFPMKRHAVGLALLTIVLALPVWADDKPAAEEEKLYGTWVSSSVTLKGKDAQLPFAGMMFVFSRGGRLVMKKKDQPEMVGRYKTADAKGGKDFREIGLFVLKDGEPVVSTKGIYRIEGDTLLMAFPADKDGPRPTELDPMQGGVLIFKRPKK